jgi:hypothetical protein
LEKSVSGSYKGNLARRAGAICRVLGECDAGLATNATCALTAAGKNSTLSECTVEGISSGAAVAGISATSECSRIAYEDFKIATILGVCSSGSVK